MNDRTVDIQNCRSIVERLAAGFPARYCVYEGERPEDDRYEALPPWPREEQVVHVTEELARAATSLAIEAGTVLSRVHGYIAAALPGTAADNTLAGGGDDDDLSPRRKLWEPGAVNDPAVLVQDIREAAGALCAQLLALRELASRAVGK